jgi:hypothetical protein
MRNQQYCITTLALPPLSLLHLCTRGITQASKLTLYCFATDLVGWLELAATGDSKDTDDVLLCRHNNK